MKILFFAESIQNSAGIERMTVSLANELCAYGETVSIVVCGSSVDSFYSVDKRVAIYTLGYSFHHRLKAAICLRKLVKNIKPDILINVAVPMGQISFLALSFLTNRPKVVGWEHFHLYAGSRMGYLFRLLSACLCDMTVVLTDQDKHSYPKSIQRKICRIYNFTVLKPEYVLCQNNHIVLSVGRLAPQKGYDLLLPVWKQVVEQVDGWKLRIVGNGAMKESLLKQAGELGLNDTIEFFPATPHVVDYYRECPVYVMSSRFEGLPMVLIEAKACGMACVSYDCPNGPSEIIRNGIDGYVVPMGNENELAQSLIKVLTDVSLQKQFGKFSVDDVLNRFSPLIIVKEWVQLFAMI